MIPEDLREIDFREVGGGELRQIVAAHRDAPNLAGEVVGESNAEVVTVAAHWERSDKVNPYPRPGEFGDRNGGCKSMGEMLAGLDALTTLAGHAISVDVAKHSRPVVGLG